MKGLIISISLFLLFGCINNHKVEFSIENRQPINFDSAVFWLQGHQLKIKTNAIRQNETVGFEVAIDSLRLNKHDFSFDVTLFTKDTTKNYFGNYYNDLSGMPNKKFLISPQNDRKVLIRTVN